MTDLILPRRKFLTGLAALVAAPAVVRAVSLMPVRRVPMVAYDAFGNPYDAYVTLFAHDGQVLKMPYYLGVAAIYREMSVYGDVTYQVSTSKDEFPAMYLEGLTRA